MRIGRLEAQIRQLTGAIEQLQHRNQQLEAQVQRMRGRRSRARAVRPPHRRSRRCSRRFNRRPRRPRAGAATRSIRRRIRTHRVWDESLARSRPAACNRAPAAWRSLSPSIPGAAAIRRRGRRRAGRTCGRRAARSVHARGRGGERAPALAIGRGDDRHPGRPSAAPGGAGAQVATLPPSDSPRDSYDMAYGYVTRKDYALAEDGFRNFLRRFPGDRLVPDAQYWLGESMFQRQRYRDAAEQFLGVSTKFENNARAPDALLRLGQSLAAMGEREAACASLAEVLRKYPRASVAVRQGVDREQKRVRC